MRALPHDFRNIQGDQITGLSCPSCPGVLMVRVATTGESFLHFQCRIGHTFSTEEVLAAKGRQIVGAGRDRRCLSSICARRRPARS
jgi:hypothetical protein